ncbi:hypothetical protein M0Q50_03780 [bacterium]|jgi:hypothetical protein|nr:hypothetical protein [bacterium]
MKKLIDYINNLNIDEKYLEYTGIKNIQMIGEKGFQPSTIVKMQNGNEYNIFTIQEYKKIEKLKQSEIRKKKLDSL